MVAESMPAAANQQPNICSGSSPSGPITAMRRVSGLSGSTDFSFFSSTAERRAASRASAS